jgi:hypothetical protein
MHAFVRSLFEMVMSPILIIEQVLTLYHVFARSGVPNGQVTTSTPSLRLALVSLSPPTPPAVGMIAAMASLSPPSPPLPLPPSPAAVVAKLIKALTSISRVFPALCWAARTLERLPSFHHG